MKYKLKVYNIWECGQRVNSAGSPHQEDSIFPAYGQQKDTDRLFILCDGMGGHEAGEVASSTVCAAMSKSVFESAPDVEGDFNDDDLQKAIDDAFDALDRLPSEYLNAKKKMGTTMTFLKFHNKGCTIAHMGDSRVYHIRPGRNRKDTKILFKTNDHSLVNDLIKVGELTPEEAKQSKQKNIITRAMQPEMECRHNPDIYHTIDIKKGDFFYMCSDGMLEQMEDENLLFNFSEAAGDDDNKVKILTQATSQNADNHSAIIIHVIDVIDPITGKMMAAQKTTPIMVEIEKDEHQTIVGKFHQTKRPSKKKRVSIVYMLLGLIAVFVFCLYLILSMPDKEKTDDFIKTETPQNIEGKTEKGIPERADETIPEKIIRRNVPIGSLNRNNQAGSGSKKTRNSENNMDGQMKTNDVHPVLSHPSLLNDEIDDDVVNSDEQTAIEAASRNKKNKL